MVTQLRTVNLVATRSLEMLLPTRKTEPCHNAEDMNVLRLRVVVVIFRVVSPCIIVG
jgi:hypothetical protein